MSRLQLSYKGKRWNVYAIIKLSETMGLSTCWLVVLYSMFVLSIIGPTICTIYIQFILINNLYMFWALFCSLSVSTVCTAIGIFLCICQLAASRVGSTRTETSSTPTLLAASRHNMYTKYTNCCTYSTSWWWAKKCSKHVEVINRNKQNVDSAYCWTYYADILRCTVNKTLKFVLSLSHSLCLYHLTEGISVNMANPFLCVFQNVGH
jgi:hypothetical protein